MDAEFFLLFTFSIFSQQGRSGQVDDICSSRPWRLDIRPSQTHQLSFPSKSNAFINTHLWEIEAFISTNPENVWLSSCNTTTRPSPRMWHYT